MTARRAPLAVLIAMLAISAGCGPAVQACPARDTIVLLGGNVLAGSTRVAQLLSDIAGATDVLGPAHFEVIARRGAAPADLPTLLGEDRGDVRAVIAVIGDLGLLDGVDPNSPIPEPGRLIRRDIDRDALETDLRRLAQAVEAQGARLILATAPLGRQGRIEVPELIEIAAWLRQRGPVLDLGRSFAALETAALFSNGIDQLDDYGHDELALAVYRALLEQQDLLPPRDPAETRARGQMRALGRWAADDAGFRTAAERLLDNPLPPDSLGSARNTREATRRLALLTLLRGLTRDVAREWELLEADGPGEIPGLATGRALCALPPLSTISGDSLERELVQLVGTFEHMPADGDGRVRAFVQRHPERLEAWLTLEASMPFTGIVSNVRTAALTELGRYDRGPVALSRCKSLLDDQPASLRALPALVIASRPFLELKPTGPVLQQARHAARRGHRQHALRLLDRVRDRGVLHRSWSAERGRIAQGAH